VKRSLMVLYGWRRAMSPTSHQGVLSFTNPIRWYVLFVTLMTLSFPNSIYRQQEAILLNWMKTCKKIFLPNGKNGLESRLKILKTIIKWLFWMQWSTFLFILLDMKTLWQSPKRRLKRCFASWWIRRVLKVSISRKEFKQLLKWDMMQPKLIN